jgi:NAD(P)-dependent dehydrogenase (short-subunit alcohol dehydrogenase family)
VAGKLAGQVAIVTYAAGTERCGPRHAGIPHARPDRPPVDLDGLLLRLASADGYFINGQTIDVDGGWVIRR